LRRWIWERIEEDEEGGGSDAKRGDAGEDFGGEVGGGDLEKREVSFDHVDGCVEFCGGRFGGGGETLSSELVFLEARRRRLGLFAIADADDDDDDDVDDGGVGYSGPL